MNTTYQKLIHTYIDTDSRRDFYVRVLVILIGALAALALFLPHSATATTTSYIEFNDSAQSSSDLTTYTFTNIDLGTPAVDRCVIVSAYGKKFGGASSLTSLTIGGEAATIIDTANGTDANTSIVALAAYELPTGATSTIVVTWANSMIRSGIGVWTGYGLESCTSPFQVASSTASDPTANLDIPEGGVTVGAGVGDVSGTWSGLPEDFVATLEGSFTYSSGASDYGMATETDRTITIDYASGAENAGIFVSWAAAITEADQVGPSPIEYLLVGGGGGGGEGNGFNSGGGGGAGGLVHASFTPSVSTYTILVGRGGTAAGTFDAGENGNNSVLFGISVATSTAFGGGGGGAGSGRDGGSGGGGYLTGSGGTGVLGQGTDGGTGTCNGSEVTDRNSSGGGGAGEAGTGCVDGAGVGGPGGDGLQVSITGSATYYAGGGGGGSRNGTAPAGGLGGGGNGAHGNSTAAQSGTDGLGGGGGGNGGAFAAGDGGDGVVILRWLTADYNTDCEADGGTETTDGAYTVCTFNTSGTLNVIPMGYIILSGTLYQADRSTVVATSSVIKVAAGNPVQVYTGSSAQTTGLWDVAVTSGHTIDTGEGVVVWVDGDSTISGSVVTVANSSTTNITGLDIYQDHIITRHEAGISSTTISDFATYDAADDSDIMYIASAAAETLTVQGGKELYVWPGSTLNGGTAITTISGPTLPGSITVASGATFEAPTTLTLAGNLTNSGTYDSTGSTLEIQSGQSVSYKNGVTTSVANSSFWGMSIVDSGTKVAFTDITNDVIEMYNLSTAYDLSTAGLSSTYDVSGEDGFAFGVKFNTSGTQMFVLGGGNNTLYAYDLGTAFDVSTASATDTHVFSQVSTAISFAFNSAGTKLFVGDESADDVSEFTLSAWDITTLSYVDAFDVSAQTSSPYGLTFSSTGDEMFMTDGIASNGEVYQYDLGTAFDVSTAVLGGTLDTSGDLFGVILTGIDFDNDGDRLFLTSASAGYFEYSLDTAYSFGGVTYNDLTAPANTSSPFAVRFSETGDKMFVLDYSGAEVDEYDLGTDFDASTASYNSSFDVSNEATAPGGFAFSATGSKMYISDLTTGTIYEYDVSTPWDVSTASYNSNSYDTGVGLGIAFNDDGSILFAADGSGSIYEYSLSTNWDVSSASYDTFHSISEDSYSVAFNSAGTQMYVGDVGTANTLGVYPLGTPFDISTYGVPSSVALSELSGSDIIDIAFDDTGSKAYILSASGGIYEYGLDPVFTFSGSSFTSFESLVKTDTTPEAVTFGDDGTKVYTVYRSAGLVGQFAVSTPYDLSTATYKKGLSIEAFDTTPRDVQFNATGSRMYLLGDTGNDITEFSLSTPWDISSAAQVDTEPLGSQETSPRAMILSETGDKMFVVGTAGIDVNEYTLGTDWDISTASFVDSFDVSSEDTQPSGIVFNTTGTKMFILGDQNDSIFEYTLSSGFDVSTASYDGRLYDLSDIETLPSGIDISPDGFAMFVSGTNSRTFSSFDLASSFTFEAVVSTSTLSGTLAGASALATVTASFGNMVFANNASTTDFTIDAGVSVTIASTSNLETSGNFANDGSFTAGQSLYLTGTDKTVSGSLTTDNQLGETFVVGAYTFNSEAEVENMTITATGSTTAPVVLTVTGDLTNNGSFNANEGLVRFSSTTPASISGDFTGASSLADVRIVSGSVVTFGQAASTTNITIEAGATTTAPATDLTIAGSFTNNGVFENNSGTLQFSGITHEVSALSYDDTFSISAQESVPEGLAFNTDGTKLFVIGSSGDDVNEYALLDPFDLSTARFVDSFRIASQETSPTAVTFSTTGTRMFVVGTTNDSVFQYDLASAFDVSSAVYTHATSVSLQELTPEGLSFNTDGTKMFVVGSSGDDVNEYTLSSPWDVSSAVFVDATLVNAQENAPTGIVFNTDGTKMFIVGDTGNDINEYTLSGAFDASTRSFVDSFAVTAQDSTPTSVQFNTDGTQMFVLGDGFNNVNRYLLTVGFDVSTAYFDGLFSISAQDLLPSGVTFNTDGTKMFVAGDAGNDINEYTLAEGFDVSTAAFVDSFSVASQETSPSDVAFNTDGTKMYVSGDAGNDVGEYNLGSVFDVSTAVFAHATSVAVANSVPTDVEFNPDGTKMFVLGSTPDSVAEFTLGTAFDISTASYVDSFSVSSEDTVPTGLLFNKAGTAMFVLGDFGNDINEYTLGTPWDISTGSFITSYSIASEETSPSGMAFNAEGTKLVLVGSVGDDINEYDLSNPVAVGVLTGSSSLADVIVSGTIMFESNASTSDVNVGTDGLIGLPAQLSVSGSFSSGGEVTAGSGTTTLTGIGEQFSGSLTDDAQNNTVVVAGDYTFSNATTAQMVVDSGATLNGSGELTVLGDYLITGAYGSGGTVVFAGTGTQIATGTMTGVGAFDGLKITNTSGLGSSSQSVLFGAPAETDGLFTIEASSSVQFSAGQTYTFNSVDWTGEDGQLVYLRSSNPGTAWDLDTGTQVSVSYVDVRDSDATITSGGVLAYQSTDAGNNTNWTFEAGAAPIPWNATDWTTYDVITIAAANIDDDLTDFPVYVNLADLSADFWAGVASDAGDIRVTTHSGSPAELSRELVSASTTLQTGELHFKANSVSSTTDTSFRIYYNGSSSIDYITSATYGAENVWSDYAAVWHMNEDPSGGGAQLLDSTQYGNNGTSEGSMTSGDLTAGRIGNAIDFDGDDDAFDLGSIGPSSSLYAAGEDLTVTAFVNHDRTGDFYQRIFDKSDGGIAANGYYVALNRNSTNGLVYSEIDGDGGHEDASAIAAQNQWEHVAYVFDDSANEMVHYVGGAGYTIAAPDSIPAVTTNASIGTWNHSTGREFNGEIDELRISTTTRSAAWISAERLNQSTTTDFYSLAQPGVITIANHSAGQVSSAFGFKNATSQPAFAFELTPAGENATITSITIGVSGISDSVSTSSIPNIVLYRDTDNDAEYDVTDQVLDASGEFTFSGESGTIVFEDDFIVTATGNYLVTFDLNNVSQSEMLVLSLATSSVQATGVVFEGVVTVVGAVSSVQHIRNARSSSGSSGNAIRAIGGSVPGDGDVGGGEESGGEEIGAPEPDGENITPDPNFKRPSSTGDPDNDWTNPTNAYVSDGIKATASFSTLEQSYGGFGFTIPASNQITGIEVKVDGTAEVYALNVSLSWDGGTTHTSSKGLSLGITDVVDTVGTPADLWGRTWTPSEFSDTNFRLRIQGTGIGGGTVDGIEVRVYHQATGGGGGGGGSI